jgi:hypothetical protein
MANRLRRVPLASKVDALNTEISGDENLVAHRNTQYCCVIADAFHDPVLRASPRLNITSGGPPNPGNQDFFL